MVLHGTPNDDFYEFSEDKIGSTTDAGWLGRGFYFYGNNPEYARQYAKGGRVIEAYLDIRNPYYATSEDMERLAEANDPEESRRFREALEAEGYDGVYYNGDLNEEWVAFRPEQIKSAEAATYDDAGNLIPPSKRFDSQNDDIRFRDPDEEGNGGEESLGELMRDGSMGMWERITLAKVRLSAAHAEDAKLRDEARRTIAKNLMDLHRAMGAQREFDRSTTKRVADLARVLIGSGYMGEMSGGEVKKISFLALIEELPFSVLEVLQMDGKIGMTKRTTSLTFIERNGVEKMLGI